MIEQHEYAYHIMIDHKNVKVDLYIGIIAKNYINN